MIPLINNILKDIKIVLPGAIISVLIMLALRFRMFKKTGGRFLIFGIELAKIRSPIILMGRFLIQLIAIILSRIILRKLSAKSILENFKT